MLLEEAFNAIIQQESHVKARWGSSAAPPDLSDSAERTDLIGAPQTLLLLRVNCLKKPESSSNKEYEGLLYTELLLVVQIYTGTTGFLRPMHLERMLYLEDLLWDGGLCVELMVTE